MRAFSSSSFSLIVTLDLTRSGWSILKRGNKRRQEPSVERPLSRQTFASPVTGPDPGARSGLDWLHNWPPSMRRGLGFLRCIDTRSFLPNLSPASLAHNLTQNSLARRKRICAKECTAMDDVDDSDVLSFRGRSTRWQFSSVAETVSNVVTQLIGTNRLILPFSFLAHRSSSFVCIGKLGIFGSACLPSLQEAFHAFHLLPLLSKLKFLNVAVLDDHPHVSRPQARLYSVLRVDCIAAHNTPG
ncbi:hypothetical protein V8F20_004879 [Naviculisporaceae sp. PSN 640]